MNGPGTSVVTVTSDYDGAIALKLAIEVANPGLLNHFTLDAKPSDVMLRAEPQALIVTLVASGASIVTALINVLVTIYQKRAGCVIKVRTRQGDELEFPATTSPEQVEQIVEIHKNLSVDRIRIMRADLWPHASESDGPYEATR
jgi:hypothetical protein